MKKYIGYYEEVVPHVLCRDIINYNFNFQPSTYANHKGKTKTSNERVCMDEVWIKNGNVYYNDIKAAFEYTIKKYSEEHELFSVIHHTDFRVNKYSEGGFMSKHCDNIHHSHGQKYGFPQVSSLLFLNDNYDGGEFVLCGDPLEKKQGSAVVFPSNFMFPHEVKPITNGIRWSVITWLI